MNKKFLALLAGLTFVAHLGAMHPAPSKRSQNSELKSLIGLDLDELFKRGAEYTIPAPDPTIWGNTLASARDASFITKRRDRLDASTLERLAQAGVISAAQIPFYLSLASTNKKLIQMSALAPVAGGVINGIWGGYKTFTAVRQLSEVGTNSFRLMGIYGHILGAIDAFIKATTLFKMTNRMKHATILAAYNHYCSKKKRNKTRAFGQQMALISTGLASLRSFQDKIGSGDEFTLTAIFAIPVVSIIVNLWEAKKMKKIMNRAQKWAKKNPDLVQEFEHKQAA